MMQDRQRWWRTASKAEIEDASSLMGDLDGSMIPMPITVLVALTEGIKVVTEPSDELVDEIGRTLFEYLVPALGLEDKIHVKDMWWKAARDALAVIREEVNGRGISDRS